MRQVYLSGSLVPEDEARVSIFDAGFMLGDTVTESARTFAHRPFRLSEHIERLYRSLKVVRADPGCSAAEMERLTLDLVEQNLAEFAPEDDCWIVHNVSRGMSPAGADPTRQHGPATVVIATPPMDLRPWARFYSEGCHAVLAMSRAVPSQALDPRVKNRSRLAYTMAEIEAKLVDPAAQCVILDADGYVTENKGGNIFAVTCGELRTPTTRNALAGISRQTVIELAAELAIRVVECDLAPYDLYTADELFMTSTPYCIMPATQFNKLPVGEGAVGPITRRLLEAWSARVGVDIAAQAQGQLVGGS